MIRAERHERILSELARHGSVSAQGLATLLGASLATIRRDISDLDGRGVILRTHGGATLPQRNEELPFDAKLMSWLPEKRRIAAQAADLIGDRATIGCGGGTTVMQMLPAIRRKTLTVVTTAINVALELREAEDITVVVTGGVLRRRTAEVVGHVAERTLRDFNLDVAVIGTDGLDAAAGVTTYDSSEAYVNRVLVERAREVWILADHSKFGRIRPALICPATAATRIVTDTAARDADVAPFEALGIEVLRV